MKILLTGAAGMIARAIRRVGAGEHEFVLMDVSDRVLEAGGIRASVTDRDAVFRAAEGCDAIVHTAAVVRPPSGTQPSSAAFIEGNVIGADNLFQAALRHGIRRVIVSSTMEIVWGASNFYGTRILDEDVPPRPEDYYAVTKLLAESLGSFYARAHGLEIVQLRYAAVQDKAAHELGFTLLSHRMTATDVARANFLAIAAASFRDEVFCLGPDSPLCQEEVDAAIKDPWPVLERHWPGSVELLRGKQITPRPDDFWPAIRVEKAKRELQWQPESRFDAFLKHLGWTKGR